MLAFDLPQALRAQIEREALAAMPRECCGLIEGMRTDDRFVALALHAATNVALERDRFEIDPAEQFRLLRTLRGSAREIIGCYHSHPDGDAVPSARDRLGITEDGFVWAITACNGKTCHTAAFVAYGDTFSPLRFCERFD